MDHLSNLLNALSLNRPTQNLEFVNFDPHTSYQPRFKTEHNDLYFYCQVFVTSAIALYSCLFSLRTVQGALYNYRRSKADPQAAEQFLLRYDVEPHEPVKDEHYYVALHYIIELFRPKWLMHPVHFTDLRFYPWNTDTSAERPFTTSPIYTEKLKEKFANHEIPNQSTLSSSKPCSSGHFSHITSASSSPHSSGTTNPLMVDGTVSTTSITPSIRNSKPSSTQIGPNSTCDSISPSGKTCLIKSRHTSAFAENTVRQRCTPTQEPILPTFTTCGTG